MEINRSDEREHQIQCLEKENQMLRETISQLERKFVSILNERNLSSGISFCFSIEEINREKHALNDTNESLSRDLAKMDAEK